MTFSSNEEEKKKKKNKKRKEFFPQNKGFKKLLNPYSLFFSSFN